jgi:hypothetical protein
VQIGSDIIVQVDEDGAANGANWTDVAILSGYGTGGSERSITFSSAPMPAVVIRAVPLSLLGPVAARVRVPSLRHSWMRIFERTLVATLSCAAVRPHLAA